MFYLFIFMDSQNGTKNKFKNQKKKKKAKRKIDVIIPTETKYLPFWTDAS